MRTASLVLAFESLNEVSSLNKNPLAVGIFGAVLCQCKIGSSLFVFVRPTQMKAFSLSKAKETEAITEGSTAAVAALGKACA